MHEWWQRVAVAATTDEKSMAARQLAAELNLHFLTDCNKPEDYEYLLLVTPEYLGLQQVEAKERAPFFIDFLSGKMQYRRQQASLRKESLARALGCKPSAHLPIVDATAGLGRDSFILASLGFEMTMLERSPVLFAMLRDALSRAKKDITAAASLSRLALIHADASHWLAKQSDTLHPAVIYLDPMFPKRQKSASVKKEMIIMQDLLGKDTDSENLFLLSLTCAAQRVVVKRPRLAAYLCGKKPSFSIPGTHSRFDIYLQQRSTTRFT